MSGPITRAEAALAIMASMVAPDSEGFIADPGFKTASGAVRSDVLAGAAVKYADALIAALAQEQA